MSRPFFILLLVFGLAAALIVRHITIQRVSIMEPRQPEVVNYRDIPCDSLFVLQSRSDSPTDIWTTLVFHPEQDPWKIFKTVVPDSLFRDPPSDFMYEKPFLGFEYMHDEWGAEAFYLYLPASQARARL
jgi:hypothetical protein